jgi:hypothetical protein
VPPKPTIGRMLHGSAKAVILAVATVRRQELRCEAMAVLPCANCRQDVAAAGQRRPGPRVAADQVDDQAGANVNASTGSRGRGWLSDGHCSVAAPFWYRRDASKGVYRRSHRGRRGSLHRFGSSRAFRGQTADRHHCNRDARRRNDSRQLAQFRRHDSNRNRLRAPTDMELTTSDDEVRSFCARMLDSWPTTCQQRWPTPRRWR